MYKSWLGRTLNTGCIVLSLLSSVTVRLQKVKFPKNHFLPIQL